MKSWTKPTDDLVQKALESVKTEVERQYFFSRLKNPHWIEPLKERGFFDHPPKVKELPNGYVQYPFWPEFQFLVNIANEASEQVVEIILEIPQTDNPSFYKDVIDIALNIEASFSIKLKKRILEYIQGKSSFLDLDFARFDEVLSYWVRNDKIKPALELAKELIAFQADPQGIDKQKRRRANPADWTTDLEPRPRFDEWEYYQILEKGVQPLAEREPYPTAQILLDATATMIRLRLFYQDDLEESSSNDSTIFWPERVNELGGGSPDSEEILIHTLTFACEKVYEKTPESVSALDQALRNQRWGIFTRIRQHLYALHINEQTKPWIREMILTHEDYDKREHHFEFQRMIRLACENFGADLLSETEKERIFDAVLRGPSRQVFQNWAGDSFTEELFEERKRYFHRKQLNPFASVLFGKYGGYFEKLKTKEEKSITGDDYEPYESEGVKMGEKRSPKPIEELKKLSDEKILSFLNGWENVHFDPDEWWVDINFEGLAEAFQSIFKEIIILDESRLQFWIENRDRLKRPIYVKAIVSAIHEQVKLKQFDKLDQWFDLCEWILAHPDQPNEEGLNRSDVSREHPSWQSSRRAVGDFVGMCLEKDINVPISGRQRLASLLDKLCTQYDILDEDEPVLLNRDNQLIEAIDNTRSTALKHLVDFGYWIRRQSEDDQADTPEVFTILEKRLSSECKYSLTLPEYAILGLNYGRICYLNREWAVRHKNDLLPQDKLLVWKVAFESFLQYNRLYKQDFDIVRDDIEFALENIDKFKTNSANTLSEHLFTYYLWKGYPLRGDSSLLEKFYEKTKENKKRWSHLFDYVGRRLKNSGKQLEADLKQRIIDFFDWRFEKKEPSELKEFTSWLEAECLDAEWRLKSNSSILDVCGSGDIEIYTQVNTLQEMIEDHTALVVECFAKLTDFAVENDGNFYIPIPTDKAKPILQAGLNSGDDTVRANAERARENLLRCGRFDFLDMEG